MVVPGLPGFKIRNVRIVFGTDALRIEGLDPAFREVVTIPYESISKCTYERFKNRKFKILWKIIFPIIWLITGNTHWLRILHVIAGSKEGQCILEVAPKAVRPFIEALEARTGFRVNIVPQKQ